ncbi:MAG: hypothetical protein KF721_07230 [Ignavibacteriaceae bacterium]|nr:hypothetical protein [Ignavibacteriaceae bacterium]
MKKFFFTLLLVLLSINYSSAQFAPSNASNLTGGLGLTWIDGKPFYAVRFTPEFSFSKIGVGLDLNLEFNSDGLRKENFNETSDYLSIIRYVRYGNKREKVYVKLGALDYYTLGHGSILYAYNNSPSFDNRKIGLTVDLDFDKFGFESIYSSFGEAGIVGLRGYARPMQYTPMASVPVLGNLEVGVTVASDFNDNAGKVYGLDTVSKSMSVFGFDLGLPVVTTSMLNLSLYYDFVKFADFGSGSSAGALLELNGLGVLNASVKLERRWNGKEFMPAYFGSLYEIERLWKANLLKNMSTSEDGYFGALNVGVLGVVNVLGSFQKLDNDPNSGILHINSEVAPASVPFVARAGYDKVFIKDGADMFKLDDRSYLFAELGYKPYSFMIVSMIYQWTYTPIRGADDKIIGYTPQKKIEPRVSFVYPL